MWTHPFYYGLFLAGLLLTGFIAAIGAAEKFPNQELARYPSAFVDMIGWLRGISFTWSLGLAVIAAVIGAIVKQIGKPWILEAVKGVLDNWEGYYFGKLDQSYNHRVTLFKYRRFYLMMPRRRPRKTGVVKKWWHLSGYYWPWDGWLVPIARSGKAGINVKTVFWASKRYQKYAEGIAGQAWARRKGYQPVIDAPNPRDPALSKTKRKEAVALYARQTSVPREWVEDRLNNTDKEFPLCICASPVGKNEWGVVVLDSTERGALETFDRESYKLLAGDLELMIERL